MLRVILVAIQLYSAPTSMFPDEREKKHAQYKMDIQTEYVTHDGLRLLNPHEIR